jgi:serine/threonine-protein kinase RsbW
MTTSAGHSEHQDLVIHNARSEIDRVEAAILGALSRAGYPDASVFAVRLALEEALVNAFRHGHRNLPKDLTVSVSFRISSDRLTVAVTDQGPGFDPGDIPDPTEDENLEKPSGRGLMLIRSFMTDVKHELGGRRLIMSYEKPAM